MENLEFYNTKVSESEHFTLKTQYQNAEYIGNGSYGIVVKAYDTINKKLVAIKKVKCNHPEMGRYYYRELTLLKSTKQRHTVALLDVFTPAKTPEEMEEFYLVMEYMEKTLQDAVLRTHDQVALIIYQLLIALNELQERNIIHRDIKPSNIGIRRDYTLKLLDFGMAREKAQNNSKMTNGVQTLIYRAPEILLDTAYDNKVDVWSLGCIFAELLTGEKLFKERNEFGQLTEIMRTIGRPSERFIQKLSPKKQNAFRTCDRKQSESLIPDSKIKMEDADSELNMLARDLLSKLLRFDPETRLSVEAAVQHPYFKVAFELYDEIETDFDEEVTFEKSKVSSEDINNETELQTWKEIIYRELCL